MKPIFTIPEHNLRISCFLTWQEEWNCPKFNYNVYAGDNNNDYMLGSISQAKIEVLST